jgi:hypothetical protein
MKRAREDTLYRVEYTYEKSRENIDVLVSDGDNILEHALSLIQESEPNVKLSDITSIEVASSCDACRNDASGQQDHMMIGGCMYVSSSSSPPSSLAL